MLFSFLFDIPIQWSPIVKKRKIKNSNPLSDALNHSGAQLTLAEQWLERHFASASRREQKETSIDGCLKEFKNPKLIFRFLWDF